MGVSAQQQLWSEAGLRLPLIHSGAQAPAVVLLQFGEYTDAAAGMHCAGEGARGPGAEALRHLAHKAERERHLMPAMASMWYYSLCGCGARLGGSRGTSIRPCGPRLRGGGRGGWGGWSRGESGGVNKGDFCGERERTR